jgi:hypothetical protein
MLTWKSGFEIELLAPQGRSRADLAARVARRHSGAVTCFFHPQSEPSAVPGRPIFENLTPGFTVTDASGALVASFVDDLTLQRGLAKSAAPRPGWFRIVADDGRLLRLVMQQCRPDAPLQEMLRPLAALFGTAIETHTSGMVRVLDDRGISVAIGAPLPGERERPCEVVTPPLETGHARVLTELLEDARAEGFVAPFEGATHIHFDAAPLLSAQIIAILVETLWSHGDALKRLVGANPNCVRLGRWPESLPALVRSDAFLAMAWPEARGALTGLGLTKYCDFNLLNIATENTRKHTFEVRILPVYLDPSPILEAASLFESLLRWCCDPKRRSCDVPDSLAALLEALDQSDSRLSLARPRIVALSH